MHDHSLPPIDVQVKALMDRCAQAVNEAGKLRREINELEVAEQESAALIAKQQLIIARHENLIDEYARTLEEYRKVVKK